MSPAPLEFRGVCAGYGRLGVLEDVSFTVPQGSVFAIFGANGAGKSTCLRVACGLLRPTAGAVFGDGEQLSGKSPTAIAKAGYCWIPVGAGVFPHLTIRENLWMWSYSGRARRSEIEEQVYARFPVLGQRRSQLAGTLSGGEQQMLAISRALTTDPNVLLVDELSMGVAPKLVTQLYDVLTQLAENGLTVVIVEQFAEAALGLATNAAVLSQGKVLFAGPAQQARDCLGDIYLS